MSLQTSPEGATSRDQHHGWRWDVFTHLLAISSPLPASVPSDAHVLAGSAQDPPPGRSGSVELIVIGWGWDDVWILNYNYEVFTVGKRSIWKQTRCFILCPCTTSCPVRGQQVQTPEPRPVEISRHTHTVIKQHANIKEKRKEPMTNEKSVNRQDLMWSEESPASCVTPRCPSPPGWWTPAEPGSPGSGSSLYW